MIGWIRPQFVHGAMGEFGGGQGWGSFPEPLWEPEVSLLDTLPTSSEISNVRTLLDDNLIVYREGEYPYELLQFGLGAFEIGGSLEYYEVSLIEHSIPINGNLYLNWTVVLSPRVRADEQGVSPPVAADRPVMLACHGNIPFLGADWITRFLENVTNATIRNSTVFVIPLFYDYPLYMGFEDYATEIGNYLTANYPQGMGMFLEIARNPAGSDTDQFMADLADENLRIEDASLRAASLALDVMRNELTLDTNSWFYSAVQQDGDKYTTSNKLAVVGSSRGMPIATQASILFDDRQNRPYLDTKCLVDFFGPSDQWAQWNVRELKRFIAGRMPTHPLVPASELAARTSYGYFIKESLDDEVPPLTENMKSRASSLYDLYLLAGAPADYVVRRRYAYLASSAAQWWEYDNFPFPMQLHHGSADPISKVDNSRHWRNVMHAEGIGFDDFEYFETEDGGHSFSDLDSLTDAQSFIETKLGL